jgi:class 3 adenylate cyclase
MGEEVAAGIPNARLVILDGDDHIPFVGDVDALIAEIEEFVTGTRIAPVTDRAVATVVFTDIVDSTAAAAAMGDTRWSTMLEIHDTTTHNIVTAHGGRVVKSTGDGALIELDRPARALQCALELVAALGSAGVPVRAGAHTGEIERRGDDIAGIAVHIASRVSSQAKAGEVLASRTVRDLVAGSPFTFDDRGEHTFKGITEPWRLYAVHHPA